MTTLHAAHALVDGAIAADVTIRLDPGGTIVALTPGTAPAGERIEGLVLPGMPNLHSHAFQRAMLGLTERAGPEGDTFWHWRDVMYRFLALLDPEDVQAIAAQLQLECLRQGYTAIAEFHYLHNAPDGRPYDDPAELSQRIVAAADESGIGLTLLPVLYRRAGFGGRPATEAQRRFVLSLEAHAALCQRMAAQTRVGVAPHSLRAVTPEELQAADALAAALGPGTPRHIHVAEQEAEVADCLAWSGTRPVAWLLDHAAIDPAWCLVHATHVTPEEVARLAATGAAAGLCPSTETNLGDGIFPLPAWRAAGGRFGIGSDANLTTSPAEELRWLDGIHRLLQRRRAVMPAAPGSSIGLGLFQDAAEGGAQALGRAAGRIAPGRFADLVVLDPDHPTLVGRPPAALLDAWLTAGNPTPVRHVMVGGRWVIRDGHHPGAEAITHRFRTRMKRLAARL
ncbi:MAG: formimidoylglutamate deiminase [Rhodospirillales bacterium 69-11]|nr:MAG: formimidoylglutamate deiminase [Rhodospirillales bacterium 69-11]